MARPETAAPLSLGRFLRDLVLALSLVGMAGWAVTRWVAVPWVVDGRSMAPTLLPGERVIVLPRAWGHGGPEVGDVVLVEGPGGEFLVKRIARASAFPAGVPPAQLPPESSLEPTYPVLGDNLAESSDSRAFGAVPRHRIRGRVAWRYWPPSRLGPIE
ncbi:MAG TPA: S26 family signal peptidase [Candidatus Sulfotelmatobacter sp.]|nr:S26 family signal peptidase [Candidatus Sulfotelmatobacter sp.]